MPYLKERERERLRERERERLREREGGGQASGVIFFEVFFR
jgi:hypothetical protein